MSDAFDLTDDLGPEKVLYLHDPATQLRAILVIDNVAAGPAIGGTRMAPDVSLEECARLARAMTLKNASAGLPHGGAKAVIFADSHMPTADKERLVRAYGYAIREVTDYIPGPDMGTDEIAMAWVHDMTGRAVGLPRELGGIPLDEIGATGFGLAAAIEEAQAHGAFRLAGARIAIQGFGAVGRHAARYLAERGAVLVAVSDSGGTLVHPEGLDVQALIDWKQEGHAVARFRDGEARDRDAIIDVECEVWIPAARPDVLHEGNVDRLRAKVVAEGANIPATEEAERRLAERGVLVLPDFIVNAGGVICAAVEHANGSQGEALARIEEKIRHNLDEALGRAKEAGQLPRTAAEQMSRERVCTAMRFRRPW
ncbi:Glu/Leu/Phe/Val family dehydrogenase [Halomonas nitroreducens]|uniref:Glutamate dehydrogenase n=1 Tax=Halomonas nitroreducens TaxID=447425 RepID=A0A431V008_9GAMM|nr:Glu/Leu/Phe/Val dehydrogenase [Halomonas nitroreducens]RTQ99882.1 Glu/Leu/Phe/Val dehydrogenase [Halomonas nitroreducens]